MQKQLAVANVLSRTASRNSTAVYASMVGVSPIDDSLCRIRVSIRGKSNNPADYRAAIQASLGASVEPIAGSFYRLTAESQGSAVEYVGLVKKGIETRSVDTARFKKDYTVMAKNVLMDNVDQSVWQLSCNSNGVTVLSRQVDEDLSQLLELARTQNSNNRNYKEPLVALANAASYARFYNPLTGVIDHGYVLGREADGTVVIASRTLNDLVDIDDRMLVTCSNIHLDDTELAIHQSLYKKNVKCPSFLIKSMQAQRDAGSNPFKTVALVTETEQPLDPESVSYDNARNYYKQMFAYAPDYYKEFETIINDYGF